MDADTEFFSFCHRVFISHSQATASTTASASSRPSTARGLATLGTRASSAASSTMCATWQWTATPGCSMCPVRIESAMFPLFPLREIMLKMCVAQTPLFMSALLTRPDSDWGNNRLQVFGVFQRPRLPAPTPEEDEEQNQAV